MNVFDVVLWPVKWLVEFVLVGFHQLFVGFGFAADSGAAWVLAVVGLVVVVRTLMIPLFVHQTKSTRKMQLIAPEIKRIQDKYKDKRDVASRELMSAELLAAYKSGGANPASVFAPLLIQLPVFGALFAVLNRASRDEGAGVGALTGVLSDQLYSSSLFGASLHESFSSAVGSGIMPVIILVPLMIVVMSFAQFLSFNWDTAEQVDENGKRKTGVKIQSGLLWLFTIVFVISGIAFPVILMFYLFSSTLWTTGQTFVKTLYRRREQRKAVV